MMLFEKKDIEDVIVKCKSMIEKAKNKQYVTVMSDSKTTFEEALEFNDSMVYQYDEMLCAIANLEEIKKEVNFEEERK